MAEVGGGPREERVQSLCELCQLYCAANLDVISHTVDGHRQLRPELVLPIGLCEEFIQIRKDLGHFLDDEFMHLFSDPSQTHLRRLNLRHSLVTDQAIGWLLQHKLVELDISNCDQLTSNTVRLINEYGDQLVALFVGYSRSLLENINIESFSATEYGQGEEHRTGDKLGSDYIFNCPKLKALSVHELSGSSVHDIVATMLNPLKCLNYLDLSGCEVDVELMDCLEELKLLSSLVLFDVTLHDIQLAFEKIATLKNLRALDLGQSKDLPYIYPEPESNLEYLVTSLPRLVRLDLSGTNLAGFLPPTEVSHRLTKQARTQGHDSCSIPGLEGRHFELLGLFNCSYDACEREHIPASQVTGTANDQQTLTALQVYIDRPALLIRVLNHLFSNTRTEVLQQSSHIPALQLLTTAMKKHLAEKGVQISGSASMFYLVKGPERKKFSPRLRRGVIRVLLNAMEYHSEESVMLRNGCLTLCHFRIPQDVLFVYEQLVTVLLAMVEPDRHEAFVQRIGIHLLNCLCCQVDGREKKMVGDLGAIKVMLRIVEYKLQQKECDEMLEIAWSTMWNVTDETADNCRRFLENRGMELFLACLEEWPSKEELIRNMMGLMGNVAEVPELRPRLMQPKFVSVFSDLLSSQSDGIEVSYNACGVLAHLTFDGPGAWLLEIPSRQSVLLKMERAIERWDINSERNINYRSFEPILRLLPANHTPQAQHWAVWALCNLTSVYPAKYCQLVEKEGGLRLLQLLVGDPRPYPRIKQLATQVLTKVTEFKANPSAPPPPPELLD